MQTKPGLGETWKQGISTGLLPSKYNRNFGSFLQDASTALARALAVFQ
jgi:hypothetical protein